MPDLYRAKEEHVMCSIMGYCSPSAVYEVFMRGFQRTISRGPDASKVVDTGEGYLGFIDWRLWE